MDLKKAYEKALDGVMRDGIVNINDEKLEFVRHSTEGIGFDALECLTWGYDHEMIRIPKDYQELVRIKVWAQIRLMEGSTNPLDKLQLKLMLETMRNLTD